MTFTADERKLIAQLRKEERRWRYARWFLVATAVFIACAYGWMVWLLYLVAKNQAEDASFLLVFGYPKALFGLTAAALFLALALRDWGGSPTRRLLLKLIDEHATEGRRPDSEQDASPNGGLAKPPGSLGVSEGRHR